MSARAPTRAVLADVLAPLRPIVRSPIARELAAIAAVVATVVLVLAPLTIHGHLPSGVDIFSGSVPFATFLHERLAQGDLPLWAPDAFSGQPFAADAQSGVLYPPTLLATWLLSPLAALRAVATFHYLLAALATYGFARSLGTRRGGAAVAAVAYGVSGHLIARGVSLGLLGGAAWLPAVLVAAELAARGGARRTVLLAGALAGSLLCGSQQLSVVTVIAALAWIVMRGGRRGTIAGVLATALGCALAAVALLPRFELLRLSTSASGYADPTGIGKLVTGDLQAFVGLFGVSRSEVATLYVGAATPALAVLGVLRRRHAVALAALILLSFGWATGLAGGLMRPLPIIGLLGSHEPVRAVILALLAIAILAGLALDRLPNTAVLLVLGVTIGGAVAGSNVLRPAFIIPLVVVALACLAPHPIALPLIVLAFAGDLAWQASHQVQPGTPPWPIVAPAPSAGARFLLERQQAEGPFRVASYAPERLIGHQLGGAGSPRYRALLFNQEAMRVGLEDVGGYNPVHLTSYDALIRTSNGGQTLDRHFEYIRRAATPELRALAVRYYVSPPGAQPPGLRVVYRDQASVITQDDEAEPFARVELPSGSPVAAGIVHREPDRIVIAAPRVAGRLVVASSPYPGWHVRVDGHNAVESTSHGLLAVDVGSAAQVVEWRFEPHSLRLGALISLVALLACCVLVAVGRPAPSGRRARLT